MKAQAARKRLQENHPNSGGRERPVGGCFSVRGQVRRVLFSVERAAAVGHDLLAADEVAPQAHQDRHSSPRETCVRRLSGLLLSQPTTPSDTPHPGAIAVPTIRLLHEPLGPRAPEEGGLSRAGGSAPRQGQGAHGRREPRVEYRPRAPQRRLGGAHRGRILDALARTSLWFDGRPRPIVGEPEREASLEGRMRACP